MGKLRARDGEPKTRDGNRNEKWEIQRERQFERESGQFKPGLAIGCPSRPSRRTPQSPPPRAVRLPETAPPPRAPAGTPPPPRNSSGARVIRSGWKLTPGIARPSFQGVAGEVDARRGGFDQRRSRWLAGGSLATIASTSRRQGLGRGAAAARPARRSRVSASAA